MQEVADNHTITRSGLDLHMFFKFNLFIKKKKSFQLGMNNDAILFCIIQ
jgi:hypothetical protein